MSARYVALRAQRHPLAPAHVDCATAVMLKILDGKGLFDVGRENAESGSP
jgi:hypothetical protein